MHVTAKSNAKSRYAPYIGGDSRRRVQGCDVGLGGESAPLRREGAQRASRPSTPQRDATKALAVHNARTHTQTHTHTHTAPRVSTGHGVAAA
eukprot:3251853-Rhodomonas_salina.1